MADLHDPDFLDCQSNIDSAIAAIKAVAIQRDSDVVLALQHAAEALPMFARAAQQEGASDAQNAAWVRVSCLADLVDEVNARIDDQLLYGASVLLHLASSQIVMTKEVQHG